MSSAFATLFSLPQNAEDVRADATLEEVPCNWESGSGANSAQCVVA
jgi:hypothetical protein